MRILITLGLVLFLMLSHQTSAESPLVYTVQYTQSYRSDLIQDNIACKEKNVVYANFIYPKGPTDVLYMMLNKGTYQQSFTCQSEKVYSKLFGTDQNYDTLIDVEPSKVADRVKRVVLGNGKRFVIDWKYPLTGDVDRSRTWLDNFVDLLQNSQFEVYVKAPASYFCYQINGAKYLLGMKNSKNFIVEMYGEKVGVYKTFEEIFEKEQSEHVQNGQNYPENACPQYPSYSTLSSKYPNFEFFIEKTLHKEKAGYIGPLFKEFLSRSEDIYKGNQAFLDSYNKQIIQL